MSEVHYGDLVIQIFDEKSQAWCRLKAAAFSKVSSTKRLAKGGIVYSYEDGLQFCRQQIMRWRGYDNWHDSAFRIYCPQSQEVLS